MAGNGRTRTQASNEPEQLTPLQEQFIEELLTGKSITDAALIVGCSRRTATYWLQKGLVRETYEQKRLAMVLEASARMANLHNLAMNVLEEALTSEALPELRFKAAKFLLQPHMQELSALAKPSASEDLVREMGNKAHSQMLDQLVTSDLAFLDD